MRILVCLDGKAQVGAYESAAVPAIGSLIDTNTGAYRVVDVWHDVTHDFREAAGQQSCVRVMVTQDVPDSSDSDT